jgi:hypothetical protein
LVVRDLTVNGTIRSNVAGAIIVVWSGFGADNGISANNAGGFYALDASYEVVAMAWLTHDQAGEPMTGWWPFSVTVDSQEVLTEALELGVVSEIRFRGTFNITESFSMGFLYFYEEADITINAGVEVVVWSMVDIATWQGGARLTVNGELKGYDAERGIPIHLRNHGNVLTLNGVTYHSPDVEFFNWQIARVFIWTGDEWSGPFMMNTFSGSEFITVTINTLAAIPYLAERYPDLGGVHITGRIGEWPGITFTEDYTLDVEVFHVFINGNETMGFGADAVTSDPVVINAGVTLTIGSGTRVILVSDEPGLNAIVGGINSRIVIQPGAHVWSSFIDESEGFTWDPGTYLWNTTNQTWELEAAP